MTKEIRNDSIATTVVTAATPVSIGPFSMTSKEGMYSTYLELSGSGELQIDELFEVKNGVWKTVEGRSSLATGLAATSGDASDGKVNLSPSIPLAYCKSFKLRFTATTATMTISNGHMLYR